MKKGYFSECPDCGYQSGDPIVTRAERSELKALKRNSKTAVLQELKNVLAMAKKDHSIRVLGLLIEGRIRELEKELEADQKTLREICITCRQPINIVDENGQCLECAQDDVQLQESIAVWGKPE